MEQAESLLGVALEIRELLRLMAEPAIAQRDEKLRALLRQLAGKSQSKQQAILRMDGTQTQTDIRQSVRIDAGDLSKLVKSLRESKLLTNAEKPCLQIPIPKNFFDNGGAA